MKPFDYSKSLRNVSPRYLKITGICLQCLAIQQIIQLDQITVKSQNATGCNVYRPTE